MTVNIYWLSQFSMFILATSLYIVWIHVFAMECFPVFPYRFLKQETLPFVICKLLITIEISFIMFNLSPLHIKM